MYLSNASTRARFNFHKAKLHQQPNLTSVTEYGLMTARGSLKQAGRQQEKIRKIESYVKSNLAYFAI